MATQELEALLEGQSALTKRASRLVLDRADDLRRVAEEPLEPTPASWGRKAALYALAGAASYGLGLLLREGQESFADHLGLPKTFWTWGNLCWGAAVSSVDGVVLWQAFEHLDAKEALATVSVLGAVKIASNIGSTLYRIPKALRGVPTPSYGGVLGPGVQAVQYAARAAQRLSE